MPIFRTVLKALAKSPLRTILNRLGMEDRARSGYRKAVRASTGDVVTVNMGWVSVDFAPPDSLLDGKRFHSPDDFDEAPLIKDMISELEDDDIVLDVGAHIGYHACFAAEATPNGQVIAVEAHPLNAFEVVKNSRLNNNNIRVHSFALSDKSGVHDLSIEGENVGGSTHSLAADATESITVSTHRADDVFSVQPTVIKIDVEGAEQLVLEGMGDILSSDECRVVYCELHHEGGENASLKDFGGSPKEVHSLLKDHGFEIEEFGQREGTYNTSDIKAVKQ